MCFRGKEGRPTRQRAYIVTILLLIFLMVRAAYAQALDPDVLKEGGIVRWALSQGGITIALLVFGWSYRRDLIRAAEEKKREVEERKIEAAEEIRERKEEAAAKLREKNVTIDVLMKIVESNTERIGQLVTAIDRISMRSSDK